MSYLKKKVMKRKGDKDYIPRHIEDLITQQFIDKLLYTANEKVADSTINPYSLDSKRSFRFEGSYKYGVKPAPTATKKLKPAATSMFEFEIMKDNGDYVEVPQVLGGTYVPIKIHGFVGDYCVRTSLLKNLMTQFLYETELRHHGRGDALVAIFVVDTMLLKENCIIIK